MKKTISIILSIMLLMSTMMSIHANDDIKVILDGKQLTFDVAPQIINNRTMVPLRAIFEALGATVDWDNSTQTVNSTRGNTTISLTIGSQTMYVNENGVALDSPACLVDGRTLVPIRAVSEAFGATVEWDGSTKTVIITSQLTPGAAFLEAKTFLKKSGYMNTLSPGNIAYQYSKNLPDATVTVMYRESSNSILMRYETKYMNGYSLASVYLVIYEDSSNVDISGSFWPKNSIYNYDPEISIDKSLIRKGFSLRFNDSEIPQSIAQSVDENAARGVEILLNNANIIFADAGIDVCDLGFVNYK